MTPPLSGVVWHPWARTCYVSLSTRLAVCICSPISYDGMKDNAECRNVVSLKIHVLRGHSRSLEITPFNTARTNPCIHSNNVPILHSFWDAAIYWSKINDSNLLHLYLAPPLGVTPVEFYEDLWCPKTIDFLCYYAITRCCLRDPTFNHSGTTPWPILQELSSSWDGRPWPQ